MLLIADLRQNRAAILEALAKRGTDYTDKVDFALLTNDFLRKAKQDSEELQATINRKSKQIGALLKQGNETEADDLKAEVATAKEALLDYKLVILQMEQRLLATLYAIPNAPDIDVDFGTTPHSNALVNSWGNPATLAHPVPHWELTERHDIVDFKAGVRVAGAGFPVYKGWGARLQRALVSFFLDVATQAGYEERQVPLLVNRESVLGTGQYPDKDGQMYHDAKDDLYLIPTAEVPLTNLYRDALVPEADLPIKLVGYTPCFRREAGSYGAEVRGLNRLHQFDKVEIVQITTPARSHETLTEMVAHVELLLRALELPYRVLRLCGGDMGFTSALTYDIEVWSAGQQKWLEVSSISAFGTYQSSRLKLRYKGADGKNRLAHTLNGSALALPRIVAALLENNVFGEGAGIALPAVLEPYLGKTVYHV